MSAKIAIYAGTFDPITLGHVDVIKRAAFLFDQVVVGVGQSQRKTPFYSLDKRMTMVQAALSDVKLVTVTELSGLTVDFARDHHANFLVRGVRSVMDYEYEMQIATMNRHLSQNGIETVFLPTRSEYAFISSSIVRELILIKAFDQLTQWIPKEVLPLLI